MKLSKHAFNRGLWFVFGEPFLGLILSCGVIPLVLLFPALGIYLPEILRKPTLPSGLIAAFLMLTHSRMLTWPFSMLLAHVSRLRWKKARLDLFLALSPLLGLLLWFGYDHFLPDRDLYRHGLTGRRFGEAWLTEALIAAGYVKILNHLWQEKDTAQDDCSAFSLFGKIGVLLFRIFAVIFTIFFTGTLLLSFAPYQIFSSCQDMSPLETKSPSGEWTARSWSRDCGVSLSAYETMHVTIAPTKDTWLSRFKTHEVFLRNWTPGNGAPDGAENVEVRWQDDTHLQIITPPCLPICAKQGPDVALSSPCENLCEVTSPVEGVAVGVIPSSQP